MRFMSEYELWMGGVCKAAAYKWYFAGLHLQELNSQVKLYNQGHRKTRAVEIVSTQFIAYTTRV